MTEERKRLLISIGFVWNTLSQGTVRNDVTWDELYQRLVAYKMEHKDTNVPTKYIKDPQLGRWVHTQRTAYKKKKMMEVRKRHLVSIGFVWNTLSQGSVTWEETYQRLVAFKKEHKDTNVPRTYEKDPKLGAWVNTQRTAYKGNKMTEERKRLLLSIGFVWNMH